MTGDEVRDPLVEGVQDLFDDMHQHTLVEFWERSRARATAWLIELHDPVDATVYGPREYVGPFPTEADAQRDAEAILRTVNADLEPEEHCTARICPLDPPSAWDHERGHAEDSPFPHDPSHRSGAEP